MFSSTVQGPDGGDAEDQIIEAEDPKTGVEGAIPMLSLSVHSALFAYFLTATILASTASLSESRPEFANAMYDSIPLGCATTAVCFGLILSIRDYSRKRFTSLQRGLYSISALILLLGCIVLLAFPTSVGLDTRPTKVDIASLVCLIVYALLAIAEGRVCRYPEVVTKEGKKAKLNKRMLLTILKPYFVSTFFDPDIFCIFRIPWYDKSRASLSSLF
jgi:lysylphosphatidylglycerol synthetase-like protein (DUF2156 family)